MVVHAVGSRGANETEFLNVGTLNCKTLKAEWRQGKLAHLASTENVDLVSIQEHHISGIGEDLAFMELGNKWLLVCCRADRAGGVGVLLSPRIRDSVKLTRLSNRLLRVELNLQQRKMHLFCCYAPTASSEKKDREAFFEELSRHLEKSLKDGYLTLALGDFNAPLKKSDDAPYVLSEDNSGRYIKESNENTKLLQKMLDDRKMLSLNTQFKGTFDDLETFAGPKKPKDADRGKPHATTVYGQIDHILIKKEEKWRVPECRTVPRHFFPSDHKMVLCKVKIDEIVLLKAEDKRREFRSQMNWGHFGRALDIALESKLFEDPEVAYRVACRAVQEIAVWNEKAVMEKIKAVCDKHIVKYQVEKNFHERIKQRTQYFNEKEKRVAKESWWFSRDRNVNEVRKESKQVITEVLFNFQISKEAAAEEIKDSYEMLNEAYENAFTERVKSFMEGILANEVPESAVRNVAGGGPTSEMFLNILHFANDEVTCHSETRSEEVNLRWPRSDDFSIDPIDSREVQKAAANLCDTPTSDGTGISLEAMYQPVLAERIARVCSSVLEGSPAPEKWLQCDTLTGERLTSGAARVYNTVLFHRLQSVIAPFLRRAYSGSRKELLQHDEFSANGGNIMSVEFVGGFQSVPMNCLERVLKEYSVPDRLIKGILALCPNDEYVMQQGDDLGPFLFTLLLDWIIKTAMPSDQENQDGFLMSLSLHDGLTLMTRSSDTSKKFIQRFTDSAKQLKQEVTISEMKLRSSQ